METEYQAPEYSTELIPPEGSEGVGPAVLKMLDEILKYREDLKLAEKFNRFYQLRAGKHWKNQTRGSKLVTANLLGSHHNRTVNMLTDNNPTFNAVQAGPLQEGEEDNLSILVKTTDNWWRETEQQHIFEESVSTGELYGLVGEIVTYNPDINFPEGDVETETLDPLYVSYYPPKCRERDKAEAALRWYKMTVREARREWPEFAGEIKGDLSLLQEIGDDRHGDLPQDASRKQITLSTLVRWLSGGTKASGDDEGCDELFIIEAWVKDKSTKKVMVQEETEDGFIEVEAEAPVYPGNIRRILMCNAGEIVLDDRWNPSINPDLPEEIQQRNYLYARWPINLAQSVTDPASPFGFADFEQLEQLNVEVNKSLSQFTMFKDRTARPKLINPRDSGVPNEELDNKTGIINPTNSLVAQAIRFMDSPQMPVDVTAALTLYKDFFHEVAGSFQDVTQGQKGGSEVIAAKAIAMLIEEASRMARGKIRNYSKLLRERGRMYLALAQMWYDTDRYITHQKDGKEITEPVNRDVLQIAGRINVVSGSTMPVSLIQRREEAIQLVQMGMIDQEELLRVFQWDNYKDVINRMQQGPLGEFLQKLGAMGVPQELLQMFQQVAGEDPEKIQKAIEQGEMPHFMQIVQQLMGQQQEKPDPEMVKAQLEEQKLQLEAQKAQATIMKTQSEVMKSQADAKKIEADTQLIIQKIESEITNRQIRIKGVEFDESNLRIEKAKAVAAIRAQARQAQQNDVKVSSEAMAKMRDDKGGYDERGGIRSNNETLRPT